VGALWRLNKNFRSWHSWAVAPIEIEIVIKKAMENHRAPLFKEIPSRGVNRRTRGNY
ncbi:unnamed protein product, partial [Acidithrix sp. C25]